MGYDYQKRDTADVKESAEANDANWLAYIKAGIKTWSPKAGTVHRVRFMYPTYAGRRKAIGYRVTVHPNVGPDDISFLSLSAMKDAPDPVSERLSDARRDGDADEKWAKALKEKDYLITYIVDMDDTDAGVQAWVMPDKANAALDRACIIDGVVVEIEHPEFGRVVEVEAKEKEARDKSFKWTECEFHVSERESWMSEDPDQQKEWEDFIKATPLDQCLRFEEYDTILEALGEISHGRGSRDDERPQSRSARRGGSREESPRRSSREESPRRSSRDESPRRSRETPTEPDEGHDAGDPNRPGWTDDEPEVEAPTRSRRRTRAPERDREQDDTDDRDLERDTAGQGLPERDDDPADRGPARRDTSEDTVRHRSPQHSGAPSGHVEERPTRRSRSRSEPAAETERPTRRSRSEPAAETERPTRRTRSSPPEAEQDADRHNERPPDEELAPRRRTRSRTADAPQADAPPERRRRTAP